MSTAFLFALASRRSIFASPGVQTASDGETEQ